MLKRKIGTQYSLLTEERPHEDILIAAKSDPVITRELQKYLREEGPYKYCKMIVELSTKTIDYSLEKYGYPPAVVSELGNNIFLEYTTHTVDIQTFLHKIKTIANYSLDARMCG